MIPVCEALAIDVPRRKLSELVLYSHEDTAKIVNTRERIISIRRINEGHLPSYVRMRWDDDSVQQHQTQLLACLNLYSYQAKTDNGIYVLLATTTTKLCTRLRHYTYRHTATRIQRIQDQQMPYRNLS